MRTRPYSEPWSFGAQIGFGTVLCILAACMTGVIILASFGPPPPPRPLFVAFVAFNPLPAFISWATGIRLHWVAFNLLNEIWYCALIVGAYRGYLRIWPHQPTDFMACESCHYNLTGNISGTCPECGTPVQQPTDAEGTT